MRSCRYCHHTECNRCRELQARGQNNACCQCLRVGFEGVRKAVVGT